MKKHRILVSYYTGNSFRSHDTEDYLDLSWDNLDIAKENLQARLVTNGKRISLGTFNTENEASFIYKKEKIKYIKTLADRYKNVINYNVYLKLLNYDKIL